MRSRSLALCAVFLIAGCGDDDTNEGSGGAGGATGGSGGASGGSAGASGGSAGATGGSAGAGATGGTSSGPWSCVGKVVYPQAPAATLEITKRFNHMPKPYDAADSAAFEGATLDVCAKGSDCETPSATAVTNAQGDAKLTLPTPGVGFEGFLRAHSNEIVTLDMHFWPPIADASSRFLKADWQPALFLPSALDSFAKANAGITPDPAKGHVITTTMDCAGTFTPEVTVTVNGATSDFAASGDSVFFNVAPGPITVKGKLAGGTLVAELTSKVVAGRIVALHFGPTPLP